MLNPCCTISASASSLPNEPNMADHNHNPQNLREELDWLAATILERKNAWEEKRAFACPPVPQLEQSHSRYAGFIRQFQLSSDERLVLALALAPHLRPWLLDGLVLPLNEARLTEQRETGQKLPTVETALFLICGDDIARRLEAQAVFDTQHHFYQKTVLDIRERDVGSSFFSGILSLNRSYFDLFTINRVRPPRFSNEFPAHRLESKLEWEQLVLNDSTQRRLRDIRAYLRHESHLRQEWNLGRHMKKGFRILFHGPSGTGKTVAATLIGRDLNREVYRVDLSTVVSKYIGETSKNLNNLFNTAEDKEWVLFFDEGDALFGQRQDTANSESNTAHYANQDTAFLLQRIENFNGIVIVASNFRKNIDQAFTRRFQAVVRFNIPDPTNAVRIWEENLPAQVQLETGINLPQLVRMHQMSAAEIIKAIQMISLVAIQKDQPLITRKELENCIKDTIFA